MTIYLRQSTASQEILLGKFMSSTDGTTPKTGLSIANTDIEIWKTGGTTVGTKNSGGATEISAGNYYCTLDATDTNTPGPMVIAVNVSGALYLRLECMILPAVVYDSMIAGTDYQEVDVIQWKGATAPAMTGDAYARVGAPAGASVSADIAAVKAETASILTDTAEIGAAGAGLSAVPWNAAWDAEVQSECTDALNAYDPPTNAEMEARTIAAASYFDPAADVVAHVTLVDTAAAVTTVNGLAAGTVTAAAIATGAIDADALAADAVDEIHDEVVEGTLTLRQAVRIMLAALAGKASGGGTTTIAYRDVADTKDRISATVDSDGNRTAITRDGT